MARTKITPRLGGDGRGAGRAQSTGALVKTSGRTVSKLSGKTYNGTVEEQLRRMGRNLDEVRDIDVDDLDVNDLPPLPPKVPETPLKAIGDAFGRGPVKARVKAAVAKAPVKAPVKVKAKTKAQTKQNTPMALKAGMKTVRGQATRKLRVDLYDALEDPQAAENRLLVDIFRAAPFTRLVQYIVRMTQTEFGDIGSIRIQGTALVMLRVLTRVYGTRLMYDAMGMLQHAGRRKTLRGSDIVAVFNMKFNEIKYEFGRNWTGADASFQKKRQQILYELPEYNERLELQRRQVPRRQGKVLRVFNAIQTIQSVFNKPAIRRMAVLAGVNLISRGERGIQANTPQARADVMGVENVMQTYLVNLLTGIIRTCIIHLENKRKKTITIRELFVSVKDLMDGSYGLQNTMRLNFEGAGYEAELRRARQSSLGSSPLYAPGLEAGLDAMKQAQADIVSNSDSAVDDA